MYMKQNDIINSLQQRAKEQNFLYKVPFPYMFFFLSKTIGENPWRFLIPVSLVITLVLHMLLGKFFDERILWLFGEL